jgi:hypothetical protein
MSHLNTAYKLGASRAMREFDKNPYTFVRKAPEHLRDRLLADAAWPNFYDEVPRNSGKFRGVIPQGFEKTVDAGRPMADRSSASRSNLIGARLGSDPKNAWRSQGASARRDTKKILSGAPKGFYDVFFGPAGATRSDQLARKQPGMAMATARETMVNRPSQAAMDILRNKSLREAAKPTSSIFSRLKGLLR